MKEVSVESINLLLAFRDELKNVQNKFRYGVEKMQSKAIIAINGSQQLYEGYRQKTIEALANVEHWQLEIERIEDEIESEKSCTDEDEFIDAPDELYDELDNAEDELAAAKEELEEARDKEEKARQLYSDVRMWGERLRYLDVSTIDSEFMSCENFVEQYGSYLIDAMKSV